MNMRYRAFCETLSLLSFAALLTACGGGGDGGAHPEVWFSINGRGTCGTTIVQVDLGAANAELSHRPDVCQLDDSLAERGCVADFANLQPQDVLRVTISGCTVPASTGLFRCGFHDGDLDELTDVTDVTCTCASPGCDPTPPVCADGGSNSTSCETCSNGLDDDGNGLIDCDDDYCDNSIFCSSGSSTTSSSTSTTLVGGAPVWTVVIRLAVDQLLGSLQWDTGYVATGGSMLGLGDAVQCTSLISGGLAAFNDDDAAKQLTAGLVSIAGIDGPANLIECRLEAATKPEASDFVFSNIEATTVDSLPIADTDGFLEIASITGDVGTTTTTEHGPTTTSLVETTTTLSDTTTTTVSTTTTTVPAGDVLYNIRYSLTASSAELTGALQWKTDYSGAPGTFQGAGGAVACTSPISGLFAPNDVDATKQLTLGVISFTGFAAPSILANCTFVGSAGDPPVAGDFPFTIEDQTDVNGEPITATIGVTVIAP